MSHLQYLEKAAQMVTNMKLLLHQEIKPVRAQNEGKKRARKKANLGTNTILSVQEGQDRLQQLDTQVEEQVKKAISRPRQRAPRHFSGCWNAGHTRRSCPNIVNVIGRRAASDSERRAKCLQSACGLQPV